MDHLLEVARQELTLSKALRIESINARRWFANPLGDSIYASIEALLGYPRGPRMPCLLITGDPGSGKTTILRRFRTKNPVYDHPDGERSVVPVLLVQAPPSADEGQFYNDCLFALNATFSTRSRPTDKRSQLVGLLRAAGTKMILIDELHNISTASGNRQLHFLTVMKYLTNELDLVLVCAGTDEALAIIKSDSQMDSRFSRIELQRWSMGEDYLRILDSFEARFPLKKASFLADQSMANLLLDLSGGTFAELSRILKKAAVRAVKSGTEQITKKLLRSRDDGDLGSASAFGDEMAG